MHRLQRLLPALIFPSLLWAAEAPKLKMRAQTIDAAIQIGYGLAVADVDGDRRPDIILADAKQVVWYRAPKWEKFVLVENLTPKDNVCVAARDLDGDGKAEIAVGAEWNPGDTIGSGAVFLLEPPADRTQRWSARKLPHVPTTHRMHWVKGNDGTLGLAVLPLHGRGNKNGSGEGVELLRYVWPWQPSSAPEKMWTTTSALHLTHNFDLLPGPDGKSGESLLVATKEGVRALASPSDSTEPAVINTVSAGEVRLGRLLGGGNFIATIEPMHGHELAVYRTSNTWYSPGPERPFARTSIDANLLQGHGLATGDLLGTGSDQVVVGWRGNKPGDRVGIKVYAASDRSGTSWTLAGLVDDNQMACEDLKIADLDGDGRPEIIAAGRATKNVVIYWNETASPDPDTRR
jgi:hypothetical protein